MAFRFDILIVSGYTIVVLQSWLFIPPIQARFIIYSLYPLQDSQLRSDLFSQETSLLLPLVLPFVSRLQDSLARHLVDYPIPNHRINNFPNSKLSIDQGTNRASIIFHY